MFCSLGYAFLSTCKSSAFVVSLYERRLYAVADSLTHIHVYTHTYTGPTPINEFCQHLLVWSLSLSLDYVYLCRNNCLLQCSVRHIGMWHVKENPVRDLKHLHGVLRRSNVPSLKAALFVSSGSRCCFSASYGILQTGRVRRHTYSWVFHR